MKLFSGSSNIVLAQKIAKSLDTQLSPIDMHVFPDGERRIRIAENVVDEHAFVIQSASTPVDTNYMELFFLIDALKRSGAEFVTAIIPYFGYQRQDHIFRDGEAVSLEVVISILEKLGVDRVMSVDMHSVKIPDLFTVPVNHVSALELFAKSIQENGWLTQSTILVSPDMGGIARVKKLSSLLGGMSYIAVEKKRDLTTGKITMDGISGSISGKKRAILVDDMLASGSTTILAAEKLLEEGIEEVQAYATHAVFSEDAPEKLEKSPLKNIFVTDTVDIPKEKLFSKLEVLSVSGIIAQEIKDLISV
jgi:ribose-phosphate pyrophosphokinase